MTYLPFFFLCSSESLLPEPDSKSPPDLFFLQVVRYLNDAILPLQTHFTDDVAPLMSSSNAQSVRSISGSPGLAFTLSRSMIVVFVL